MAGAGILKSAQEGLGRFSFEGKDSGRCAKWRGDGVAEWSLTE